MVDRRTDDGRVHDSRVLVLMARLARFANSFDIFVYVDPVHTFTSACLGDLGRVVAGSPSALIVGSMSGALRTARVNQLS